MPRLIHLEDRVGNNRFEVSVSQRPVVVNTTPLLNKAANTYHRHRHRSRWTAPEKVVHLLS